MPLLAAAFALLTPVASAAEIETLHVDAVRLVAGEEVPGSEELAVERGGFRYLFSTEENLRAFEAAPEAFEIQLGGACARMGPLSGLGSASIFAVHDGRIYVFASEPCREGFLKDPERLLDRDDPPPEANEATAARGRELIEKAVAAMGGAERVDGVQTLQLTWKGTAQHADTTYERVESRTFVFPHAFRTDSAWEGEVYGHVVTADDAFFVAAAELRPMHPQQRRAAVKETHRQPLVILRARNDDGFVAVAAGAGTLGGSEVDLVAVAFEGATSTLALDEDGHVVGISYRGRGPDQRFGTLERRFSGFSPVSGLTLPSTSTVCFDGRDAAELDRTWTSIAVDREVPAEWFVRER